ncbi:hypothetical protein BD779DRAFT_944207 [Infundibulicybe gibba]|nr:hypothetical protein BD779DRAFT_944207 [Infundibulicybe gibba]
MSVSRSTTPAPSARSHTPSIRSYTPAPAPSMRSPTPSLRSSTPAPEAPPPPRPTTAHIRPHPLSRWHLQYRTNPAASRIRAPRKWSAQRRMRNASRHNNNMASMDSSRRGGSQRSKSRMGSPPGLRRGWRHIQAAPLRGLGRCAPHRRPERAMGFSIFLILFGRPTLPLRASHGFGVRTLCCAVRHVHYLHHTTIHCATPHHCPYPSIATSYRLGYFISVYFTIIVIYSPPRFRSPAPPRHLHLSAPHLASPIPPALLLAQFPPRLVASASAS